jgi:hypothetical protein
MPASAAAPPGLTSTTFAPPLTGAIGDLHADDGGVAADRRPTGTGIDADLTAQLHRQLGHLARRFVELRARLVELLLQLFLAGLDSTRRRQAAPPSCRATR